MVLFNYQKGLRGVAHRGYCDASETVPHNNNYKDSQTVKAATKHIFPVDSGDPCGRKRYEHYCLVCQDLDLARVFTTIFFKEDQREEHINIFNDSNVLQVYFQCVYLFWCIKKIYTGFFFWVYLCLMTSLPVKVLIYLFGVYFDCPFASAKRRSFAVESWERAGCKSHDDDVIYLFVFPVAGTPQSLFYKKILHFLTYLT